MFPGPQNFGGIPYTLLQTSDCKETPHPATPMPKTPKVLPPGIKEFQWLDPKILKPNPLNWRKHPANQRKAFSALHIAAGWAGAAILNRTTGNLIDGHMRREEAAKKGELLPVLIGDWTEEQEKLLLANHDPLGTLAETNHAALVSLQKLNTRSLSTASDSTRKTLTSLADTTRSSLEKMNGRTEQPETKGKISVKEDAYNPEEGIKETTFKEDVVFPSVKGNPWGIPALRSDRLTQVVPRNTWNKTGGAGTEPTWYCYSAGPNTFPAAGQGREGGTLGFFTEDFRFERCWNDSGNFLQWLLDTNWAGVVSPDYSTWDSWPFPVRLHNLYRSRWCSRYWQEAGINVLPILQSIGSTPATGTVGVDDAPIEVGLEEIVLATLPPEIPVAAVQVRTSEGKNDTAHWARMGDFISDCLDNLRIHHLVIYGGDEHRKHLEGHLPSPRKKRHTEYVWLPSYISKRRTTFK